MLCLARSSVSPIHIPCAFAICIFFIRNPKVIELRTDLRSNRCARFAWSPNRSAKWRKNSLRTALILILRDAAPSAISGNGVTATLIADLDTSIPYAGLIYCVDWAWIQPSRTLLAWNLQPRIRDSCLRLGRHCHWWQRYNIGENYADSLSCTQTALQKQPRETHSQVQQTEQTIRSMRPALLMKHLGTTNHMILQWVLQIVSGASALWFIGAAPMNLIETQPNCSIFHSRSGFEAPARSHIIFRVAASRRLGKPFSSTCSSKSSTNLHAGWYKACASLQTKVQKFPKALWLWRALKLFGQLPHLDVNSQQCTWMSLGQNGEPLRAMWYVWFVSVMVVLALLVKYAAPQWAARGTPDAH